MKASEIEKGGKYIAKVSGVLTTVRVDEIREVTIGPVEEEPTFFGRDENGVSIASLPMACDFQSWG